MRYLVYKGHCNNPKNKLQEAIQEVIAAIDRIVVEGHEMDKFERNFEAMITELNHRYKACKPENADIRKHHLERDYHCYTAGCTMNLYEIKEEEVAA